MYTFVRGMRYLLAAKVLEPTGDSANKMQHPVLLLDLLLDVNAVFEFHVPVTLAIFLHCGAGRYCCKDDSS